MKRIGTLYLSLLVLISISSCNREVEDRLPGSWSYTNNEIRTVKYSTSTNEESETITGTIDFIDDGTGNLTVNSEKTTFTWSTSEDSVQFFIKGKTINYFVTDNSKDSQQWKSVQVENGSNYSFTIEQEIILAR